MDGWRSFRLLVRVSRRPVLVVLVAGPLLLGITLPARAHLRQSPEGSDSKSARGRYIVTLADDVGDPRRVAAEHERRYRAEVSHIYRIALKGYAAHLPEQAAAGIAADPRVEGIEVDQPVDSAAQDVPTGIQRIFATAHPATDIDGIDDVRIDVDVAILDTGIDLNHPDLNVVGSVDCTATGYADLCVDGLGDDEKGHGSHVAGTVAAIDNGIGVVGVAPGARLHAVKVLSSVGVGFLSWAIAGVDWITAQADAIEVANMSFGCWCSSPAFTKAIGTSVDAGVLYVAAAGNGDDDARHYSPANHPDVITASALADFDGAPGGHELPSCRLDQDDTLADFSNWGTTVEIAAPGTCILSTYSLGRYAILSGTSMASPHVAGAAALLTAGPNDPENEADVLAIRETLIENGNLDWIDDSGDGTQEPLLDLQNVGHTTDGDLQTGT